MSILQNIKSCVRRKHGVTRKPTKVHFNVKMVHAFNSENVASQLRDLLVFIAREGVAVTDLFRRPGNIQSIKRIISDLESGRSINWSEYNFYTLANIAKRFLLHIDGGILGEKAEEALLEALNILDIDARNARMKSIITSQPKTVQQLLTLLFGTWFRMIYHTEVNAMSVEAVAKSVAGSVFPSCTYSPEKVERASKVMEVLIVGFASTELFGRELIEYFTHETNTSISRVEKFKYEFRFPRNAPRLRSTQMFHQMLIEESKKHGFDILKDEVTREEFERVNQTMALDCPELSFHSIDADKGDDTGDPLRMATRCPAIAPQALSSRVPLANLQPTTPSAQYLPPPYHLIDENVALAGGSENRQHRIDRIQQYSEKRTCIIATPADAKDMRFHRRNSSGTEEGPCDSLSETDDLSDMQQLSRLKDSAVASAYGSCFNSVKKRQLERLQKRSDWFLSPPSGLRNSGMMRVDLPPGISRNSSKVLKSKNGEEVNHSRCLASDDYPFDLRRKPSNRQSQQRQTQTYAPSIYSNAHVPSASRQFTLASPYSGEEVNSFVASAAVVDLNNRTAEGSDTCPSGDELVETRYFVAVKYYGPKPSSSMRETPLSTVERGGLRQTVPCTPLRF